MSFIDFVITPFILGLLTPLTAVCVIPLYPGFLAYLANQLKGKSERKLLILFGILITLGVIIFMLILGFIFTTILQVSLTNVIGIISPIAFGILGIISLVLIFDIDVGKYLPKFHSPGAKNPLLNAFLFGLFFGAIVVPCNPAFIAALFARTLATASFITNIFSFFFFGVGIGAPLLVFSAISAGASQAIINWLIKYKRPINLIAGIIMLGVSLYYLIFVFKVFG